MVQAQIVLDRVLLKKFYSNYSTATSMSFKSKLISHIDHTAFAGVNAIQSIDLSNNSLMFVGQAFNPLYFYLVHSPASYVFNGYCNACGITCPTSCSGTTCSKTCQGYISNAQCSPTISNCYNVAKDYQTCSTGTYLNNLMTINLSSNKISHIDENSMLGCVCDTLDLSYNSLSRLVFNQLFSILGRPTTKLRVLNLNSNKLTDISQLFTFPSSYYSKLEQIDLSFNSLTTITPTTFKNVLSLSQLFLNDNKITAIDTDSFKGLANLRQLHLYNNPFYPETPTVSQLLYLLQFCDLANPYCSICLNALCSMKLSLE